MQKRTDSDLLGHRATPTCNKPNIDQSELSSPPAAPIQLPVTDIPHALGFLRTLVSNGLSENQASACLRDTTESRNEGGRDPTDATKTDNTSTENVTPNPNPLTNKNNESRNNK